MKQTPKPPMLERIEPAALFAMIFGSFVIIMIGLAAKRPDGSVPGAVWTAVALLITSWAVYNYSVYLGLKKTIPVALCWFAVLALVPVIFVYGKPVDFSQIGWVVGAMAVLGQQYLFQITRAN